MRKYHVFFYLLLLIADTTRAQFLFSSLGVNDGMSSGDVLAACKDEEGFMWFATSNGLNRYDGSGFKIYNRQNKRGKNLASDFINDVIEFDRGKIWIATVKGLFLLDKKTDSITGIDFYNSEHKVSVEMKIFKVFKDYNNKLWIAADSGLYIIKNNQAVSFQSIYPNSQNPLFDFSISFSYCTDSLRKGFWIGSGKETYFFSHATKEFYSSYYNPLAWAFLNEKGIYDLAVDKNGDIWYADKERKFSHYKAADNTVSNDLHLPGVGKSGRINKIFIDAKNNLWISDWIKSIYYSTDRKTFYLLKYQSIDGYKLRAQMFSGAYNDNEENTWFFCLNGVYKISGNDYYKNVIQLKYNIEAWENGYTPINEIKKDTNQAWWICTENGLYHFDQSTKKNDQYFVTKNTSRANRFFCIEVIENEWWCGTGDGIKIFNPLTKQFRNFEHYAPGYEIKNKSVSQMLVDKKGYLWFSVWADAIYRYDPATKTTIRFDGTSEEQGDIKPINCSGFFVDKAGNIWAGGSILRKYEYKTGRFTKPFSNKHTPLFESNATIGIAENSKQQKWISVKGQGVFLLDNTGNCIDTISTVDGLSTDVAYELLVEPNDRLWISTSEAVHYTNPDSKHLVKLSFRAPFPFGDYWPVMTKSDDVMAVSFNDIICFIDLAKLGQKTTFVTPLISSVKIFENEIPYVAEKPVVHLGYNQNFFSINFSSLQHNDISSLQYAYMLEGFNKDWIYSDRQHTASYTNVPNGKYTFRVKSTDEKGNWMDKETMITFIIDPPFWKQPWFIGLLALLIVVLSYSLYKRYNTRKQKSVIDKTIDYFANSVYGENSVNEICWDIARNCISQLQFEDCVVYLYDEKKKRLVQKAAYGPKNAKGHEIINPLEIEPGKGIVGTVAESGKPLLIPDTSKDKRYIIDDEVRLSELAVPILHDNKVIGVIDSEHSRRNFFSKTHIKTLSTIASISANKIAEAQAEAQARDNEIKLLEINKMLAESKLMALRAQMNPHFVFNCLNSIQECIVTQKYAEASNYLNKFSKLFRLVLNNSGRHFVSIQEEKEILALYLELEYMRFENKFEFKITLDETLNNDETLIPSMLLQPFVENALWHGLMHKTDGRGCLTIQFKKISNDVFSCVIEDNGIGREKAAAIKQQQSLAKKHESKGLKITTDRIEVLKKQGYHAFVNIVDKQNGQGEPAGTKVIIELSTELTD